MRQACATPSHSYVRASSARVETLVLVGDGDRNMNDGKNKAQFQRAFPASCKSTFYPDSYRWFRLAPRFVRPVRDGRRHINPEAAVSVSFFFFFLIFFYRDALPPF